MTKLGETCHLMVLEGNGVRFIDSVEGKHVLRVGSRVGRLLPANRTSGGKALLAEPLPRRPGRAAPGVDALLGTDDGDLGRALRRRGGGRAHDLLDG